MIVRVYDHGWVLELLERLQAEAEKCADAPAWSLSDAELIGALTAAHRLEQAAAAVKLHVVRQLDTRDAEQIRAWRTTAAWLRDSLRLDGGAARQLVEQSEAIERYPVVDHALSTGAIDRKQASALIAALDALPVEAGRAAITEAESTLTGLAGQFAPAALRRLGARILDHVAPDVAERIEKEMLDQQEEMARRGRSFSLSAPIDGQVWLRGRLSVEDAAVVRAALDPLCAPRPGDDRTPAQLRADALVDVCRLTVNPSASGGGAAQLTVTVPYDVLAGRIGPGRLDAGERVSVSVVRQLACDAGILPVVLGGEGQPLDLGRTRRLFTGAVRRALVVRDQGCAFPDCDRPARWTDAHHIVSWLDGGETSVRNGVLLCRHHHGIIHRGEWAVRAGSDDLPEFLPPAHLDSQRRPRRNIFHRRT